MFLSWAKNKVKKWIKKNISARAVLEYLIPLALDVLRSVASKTQNRVDDAAVDALETFWISYRARKDEKNE